MIGRASPPRRSHQHGPPRILPLSAEAISQILSSKHITTLQGVVCRLLENSLDAGADRVSISVEWTRGNCSVEDNGAGIPSAEFAENGGLGKMHCTSRRSASRYPEEPMHGSTGTFLVELAAMSLLEINSVFEQSTTSARLTMHHGKVIARQATNADTSFFAAIHHNHGTSVSVHDLFGNMPVRVKQRGLAARSGNNHEKSWHELKRNIAALLLAWPRPCSVKLQQAGVELHQVVLSSGSAVNLTKRGLGQLAGRSVRHDWRDALPVIFQASLASTDSRSRWIPLSASTSVVSLRGIICLDPSPNKQCQFIAIGVSPCVRNDAHNDLYHCVNRLFADSSFAASEDGFHLGLTAPRPNTTPQTSYGERAQKCLDRHAMYILQLSFRESNHGIDADAAAMSEATMKCLVEVLQAAVHAWLESNLFRPRKRRKRDDHSLRPLTAAAQTYHRAVSGFPAQRPWAGRNFSHDARSTEPGQSPTLCTKKQSRVLDISTELHDFGHSPGRHTLDDDARHNLTRFRSGSLRNKDGASALSPKPRPQAEDSSTATQPDSPQVEVPIVVKTLANRIRAPPLAVGQFSAARPGARTSEPLIFSSDEFGKIDDEELLQAEYACQNQFHRSPLGEEDITMWTDPVSGQVFRVSSRTGVVLPNNYDSHATSFPDHGLSAPRHQAAINTTVSSTGKPISLSRRSALAKDRPATASSTKEPWLPGFLREWKNPVFVKHDEDSIPTASLCGPGLVEQLEEVIRSRSSDKYREVFARHLGQHSEGTALSRAALQHAEVIGQVDQKFILVKMPSRDAECHTEQEPDPGCTLVLVDQHAASERIILEELLSDMIALSDGDNAHESDITIKSASLQQSTTRGKSLLFEISAREHDLFTQYRPHFQTWGISYSLPAPTLPSSLESHAYSSEPSHRLILTYLPTAIAERCSTSPTLAIELLRTEIWAFVDGARKPVPPTVPRRPTSENDQINDQPAWLSLLPHMPTKMLNMLHSRACRSAIMFNDALSIEECTVLMGQLETCTFPFVCAHGRVGMVPVMDLGRAGERDGSVVDTLQKMRQSGNSDVEWYEREGRTVEMDKLENFLREAGRGGRQHGLQDKLQDEDAEMLEASPHKFA